MDLLYRFVGRSVMRVFSHPLAWADRIWTDIYQTAFIRAASGMARAAGWLDTSGIDRVVEGTGRTVFNLGRLSARLQTGRMQEMVAWMMVLALSIFALIWFI